MQDSSDAGRRPNRNHPSKRAADAQSSPERAGGADNTGSTDESIGRPGNWREGRYQRRGAPVDQSVNEPSQSAQSAPKSPPPEQQKPVTLRDYEK